MRIPGADRAVVDDAKIRDYLLSPEHPVGGPKARFFKRLGFQRDDWADLHQIIAGMALSEARVGQKTRFGQKYIVEDTMKGPGGRVVTLVAVWIVLSEEDFPRFVTAYPGETR
jgi:hypothetical protein